MTSTSTWCKLQGSTVSLIFSSRAVYASQVVRKTVTCRVSSVPCSAPKVTLSVNQCSLATLALEHIEILRKTNHRSHESNDWIIPYQHISCFSYTYRIHCFNTNNQSYMSDFYASHVLQYPARLGKKQVKAMHIYSHVYTYILQ